MPPALLGQQRILRLLAPRTQRILEPRQFEEWYERGVRLVGTAGLVAGAFGMLAGGLLVDSGAILADGDAVAETAVAATRRTLKTMNSPAWMNCVPRAR